MAGLLGLGGFGGMSGGMPAGLLTNPTISQIFDPTAMRNYGIKRGLLDAGVALMNPDPHAPPDTFASAIGRAASGGVQGAQKAQDEYYNRGMQNVGVLELQRQYDQLDADKTAAQHLISTLPPALQAKFGDYAKQYPAEFLKAYTGAQLNAQYGGTSDRYSGQLYWVQDPKTKKFGWVQSDKIAGGVRPVELNGVEPAPTMNYLNTGTDFTGLPTKGMPGPDNMPSPIPINNAGKSQQEAIGKGQGEAAVSIPQAENAANLILNTIDSLTNDPYLDSMLGPINSRMPNLSGSSARVQSKMDQIQGQTFLQAYNFLRGSGAITEIEGAKGERALNRMATAQYPQDYRQAAQEFRQIIVNGVNAMHAKAGQGQSFTAPPAQMQPQGGQRTTSGGISYTVHP